MKPESFVVTPDNCAAPLNALGVRITVLATNVQTQGYELTLQRGDDGIGPPPHSHAWDESFYVLKGSVDITIAGRTVRCEPGTLVHLPAGTVHSFRFGEAGGEMFEITGAGGSATRLFTDLPNRIPPGPPEPHVVITTLTEHGVALAAS